MPTDLDEQLTATLNAHAGADTDPAPLVERARVRGRRLKFRRRGLLGAAVVAALLMPWSLVPSSTPPQPTVQLPAAGQPGAASRPDLIGTDPWTLHFTADSLVAGADHVTWKAGAGIEEVEYRGATGHGRLVLARDTATLDAVEQTLTSVAPPELSDHPLKIRIGNRPGTAWFEPNDPGDDLWFVRWQPVDGVWARLEIYASRLRAAVDAALQVRLDSARRCAVPFRLTTMPVASRVVSCSVSLAATGDTFTEGALVIGDDKQRWMTVRAQRTEGDGPEGVRVQSNGILERFVEPVGVEAFFEGLGHGYTEGEARLVLEGYQQADEIDDISRW